MNEALRPDAMWSEHAKKIAEQNRLKNKAKTNEFYRWLLSLNHDKRYFDGSVYRRAYFAFKELQNDHDHFTVVCGKEGSGKSTLAIQFCSTISPNFGQKFICYEMKDFLNAAKIAKKGDSILLDEGGQFLYSREATSKENKNVTKYLMLVRQKNLHICICIPQFKSVDSYIRNHRVKTLLHVKRRKLAMLIIDSGIRTVSRWISVDKDVEQVKIATEYFKHFSFTDYIPPINDLDKEKYKELKLKHFEEFHDLLMEQTSKQMNLNQYMPSPEFAKRVKRANITINEWIKKGLVKGMKVGRLYYVHKGELIKLLDPKFRSIDMISNPLRGQHKNEVIFDINNPEYNTNS